MLRSYKGVVPRLGQRVYVDASAQVIGDVELGDHASVWMNAVVRGDVHSIRIGPHTNIQDNCVVHVFKALHPTVLAFSASLDVDRRLLPYDVRASQAHVRMLARQGRIRLIEKHTDTDGMLTTAELDALVEDLAERETWACGPASMLASMNSATERC